MIIFLDIDGVLNTPSSQSAFAKYMTKKNLRESSKEDFINNLQFDSECIKAFIYLLKHLPNPQIVISSSLRHDYELEELKTIFKNNNLPEPISVTPIMDTYRGVEINQWRHDNIEYIRDDFLVVDDCIGDIVPCIESDKILHCNQGWIHDCGLTINKVKEYLKSFQ